MIVTVQAQGDTMMIGTIGQNTTTMDAGGFNWTLLTVVGAAVLIVVIAIAMMLNRTSRQKRDLSERATRELYREEERAHRDEGDGVP